MAVHDDQRGAIGGARERVERTFEHREVIGVTNACDVPSVPHESSGDVIAVGERRVAFNGDVVVVVDPAQVAEFEMPGQRRGLTRDPFHHAAVATQRVDVIVEQLEAGTIEVAGDPALGNRHSDAGRQPLSERTGRRLDA